ncbi:hypothetical protein V8U11_16065 [Pseudomonas chlororaphis]|uniref:hypothetical protein n=1 Tax=Pseudomonas chlororaphis TaxID=587753 RepID=UPI0030CF5D5F
MKDDLIDGLVDDGLIDDSGFELGVVEMLQSYNRLLEAELETTRSELQRAHKTIAGLIVMYRESDRELAALKESNEGLKVEHERLRWTLSDMYRRESERETKTMGYAYGDYSNQNVKP